MIFSIYTQIRCIPIKSKTGENRRRKALGLKSPNRDQDCQATETSKTGENRRRKVMGLKSPKSDQDCQTNERQNRWKPATQSYGSKARCENKGSWPPDYRRMHFFILLIWRPQNRGCLKSHVCHVEQSETSKYVYEKTSRFARGDSLLLGQSLFCIDSTWQFTTQSFILIESWIFCTGCLVFPGWDKSRKLLTREPDPDNAGGGIA